MQFVIFGFTGILVASVFTTSPEEMTSIETAVLAVILALPSLFIHTLFDTYDKNHRASRTYQENAYGRSLVILGIIAALVIADVTIGASSNPTWVVAFVFMTEVAAWEFFYYMLEPPAPQPERPLEKAKAKWK